MILVYLFISIFFLNISIIIHTITRYRKSSRIKRINTKNLLIFTGSTFLIFFLSFSFSTLPVTISLTRIYAGFHFSGIVLLTPSEACEYQEYIHYPEYNSSITQVVSNDIPKLICFYQSSIIREYAKYVHLKNVYCNSVSPVGNFDGKLYWTNAIASYLKHAKTGEAYTHVVFLYNSWGSIFGHFFQDALPALLFIPQEIISKSMIVVPMKPKYSQQYLELFGIPPERVLYKKDVWIFADNLYMYYAAEPLNALDVYSFKQLMIYLKDKLDINNLKGTRYVFSNREKDERRSISNMVEFFDYTKEKLPQYKWEIDPMKINNLKELAANVATIKLLVAPSGSKLMNVAFMNWDLSCGVCIISTEKSDIPNFALGLSLNIWQIGFFNDIGHYKKWQPCNISYGFMSIQRLIHALQFKEWPKDTFNDMEYVFNLTEIKEIQNGCVHKIFEGKKKSCEEDWRVEFSKEIFFGDNNCRQT